MVCLVKLGRHHATLRLCRVMPHPPHTCLHQQGRHVVDQVCVSQVEEPRPQQAAPLPALHMHRMKYATCQTVKLTSFHISPATPPPLLRETSAFTNSALHTRLQLQPQHHHPHVIPTHLPAPRALAATPPPARWAPGPPGLRGGARSGSRWPHLLQGRHRKQARGVRAWSQHRGVQLHKQAVQTVWMY
jgi:hypothetical protein